MILNLLLLIFIICISKSIIKYRKENNVLSRSDTNFIRGVAILMILFSHIIEKLGVSSNLIGGGTQER